MPVIFGEVGGGRGRRGYKMEYPTTVSVSGTETETPSLALGICEFTKVIFRPIKCSNRINWKFVSREFIQCCQEKMASRVEVSFIAESDFVNKERKLLHLERLF